MTDKELKPVKDFFDKKKDKEDSKSDESAKDAETKKEEKKQEAKKSHEPKSHQKNEADDDEISFDFSKIKRWFKQGTVIKNKKEHPKKQEKEHKDHKSKKEEKSQVTDAFQSKEFKENASKFLAFVLKYQLIILILIPLLLSVHIRTAPLDLPITDEWAGTSINNQIRNQVSNQVIAQYPNLPDSKKNELIEEGVAAFISQNREAYDNQIQQLSQQFKARFQTADGQVYLPNIDPYYYARHARSIVEKGHVGDYLNEEGIPLNTHQTAPIDSAAERHFHMYFMAYIYKFVSLFNSDAPFLTTLAWVPVFITTLAIIPMFFIAQRYGGATAGFFSAVILAVNHALLGRTSAGVADTDAYTVAFPLFILWVFIIAFDAKTTKKQAIYSVLTGLLLAFFSFAWSGWWYIFDFLLGTLGVYAVYILISQRKDLLRSPMKVFKGKEFKGFFTMTAILIPVTVLATTFVQAFRTFSWAKGFDVAINAFTAPLGIIKLKQAIRTNLWPNVLTTVAELNPGNLGSVTGAVGGKLMLFIALMGMSAALCNVKKMKVEDWIFLLVSAIFYGAVLRYVTEIMTFIFLIAVPLVVRIALMIKDERTFDIKFSVIVMLWLISTIYAVSKGLRFTMLSIPAFALGFGTAIGFLYQTAGYVKKYFKIPLWITKPLYIIIFLLLIIPPTLAGQNIAGREVPIISDAWWQSLEAIRDNTQPDAIITSWWDFGHWFKYVADRPTTFDGAAQDRPQAHWVGKALLTNNEKESVGIVRMLDCSADMGFNRIYNETHIQNAVAKTGVEPKGHGPRQVYDTLDFLEAIDFVNEVLPLERENAYTKYEQKFGKENADEFIELTHCNPPEAIFITSADMIGKSGVWGHFGSWNFSRAAEIDFARKDNLTGFTQVIKLDNPDATEQEILAEFNDVKAVWDSGGANSWIAPWPSYAGGPSGCVVQGATVRCGNGVEVDMKTMNVTISTQNQIGIPKSIVYVEGEEVKEKMLEPSAQISVALIPAGDTYASILLQHPMAGSMFNRLFYMEGHGLDHFSKIYDATAVNGQRILSWKIDWAGNSTIVVPEWVNKTTTFLETSASSSNETQPSTKEVADAENAASDDAVQGSNVEEENTEKNESETLEETTEENNTSN